MSGHYGGVCQVAESTLQVLQLIITKLCVHRAQFKLNGNFNISIIVVSSILA